MSIFRDRGLEVTPGPMNTVVVGEMQAIFDSLGDAFLAAADGEVVMVATLTPTPWLQARPGNPYVPGLA